MIGARFAILCVFMLSLLSILVAWHYTLGFIATDIRWWKWLLDTIKATGSLPSEILWPVYIIGFVSIVVMAVTLFVFLRPSSRSLYGAANSKQAHGSAKFATWQDIKRSHQFNKKDGVMVGGFKKSHSTTALFHNGSEHLIAFAPTRSGKGVSLIIPTLLNWQGSTLTLDIKGENFALTSGYRASLGHTVIRFDPASETTSHRYNPLVEVRTGTNHEIADCQNIATIIIDPDGKGLKDYWMQAGFEWLAAAILHVLYRIQKQENRVATLADVYQFMSVGEGESDNVGSDGTDDSFERLLQDMIGFEHGRDVVDMEVKRAAGAILKKAPNERSGVHSSAKANLSLYSDPIVSQNISDCDFRIKDLMNDDDPVDLYIVIPPSDIDRLKPLIRVMMSQILTRLTETMEFEGGKTKANYKHRLLLMLDEFSSIGKLDIFERALAFMAGYGLKAFIIIQDVKQLYKAYGKDESIISNCHIKIAFPPNNPETAEMLSKMCGVTTVVSKKTSKSMGLGGRNSSVNVSLNESQRPLLTADEVMSLPALRAGKKVKAGHSLIFVAGLPVVLGEQQLYFQDRELQRRASMPPAPITQNLPNPTLDLFKQQTRKPNHA